MNGPVLILGNQLLPIASDCSIQNANDSYLWCATVTLLALLQQAVATLSQAHRVRGRVLQTQTPTVAHQQLKVIRTTGAEVGASSFKGRKQNSVQITTQLYFVWFVSYL